MSCTELRTAAALVGGCDATTWGNDELVAGLRASGELAAVLDQRVVEWVAAAERRGVFTERGYRDVIGAVSELLGLDRAAARLRVRAAEHVHPRIGLDGAVLVPKLPATASGFTAGRLGVRHVDTIAAVLDSPAARRLSVAVWTQAEQQLAARAASCTPTQLASWGRELIEILDDDGAAPDDDPPPPTNELLFIRHRDGSGRLKGRFDDPMLFAAITTAIDSAAAPRDGDDRRPVGSRQAEALAEVCAQVLDHGHLPEAGGTRPQLVVHIGLAELQGRVRSAVLDTGGICDPAGLRRLACDAAVIPLVLGGAGQPLDVGRATRTIPDGMRRAVLARDRGCAHPGCDRPPSWTEIHHIQPWADGGHTKIDNLVALCRVHHRLTHAGGWEIRMVGGIPHFRPPAWIDPDRTPRRRPPPPRRPTSAHRDPRPPHPQQVDDLDPDPPTGPARAATVLTADELIRGIEDGPAAAVRTATVLTADQLVHGIEEEAAAAPARVATAVTADQLVRDIDNGAAAAPVRATARVLSDEPITVEVDRRAADWALAAGSVDG